MDLDPVVATFGAALQWPPGDLERVLLAAGTACLIVVVLCPAFIRVFRRLRVVERCGKTDSPKIADLHGVKNGTATMGGLLLIGAAMASSAIWADWDGVLLPSIAFVLVLFGAIGALDDLIKIRHPTCKGLGRRFKLFLLGGVALLAASVLYAHAVAQGLQVGIVIQMPFTGWTLPIGPLFVMVAVLAVTGSANAVNLTDGLDGLAPGLLVLAFSAFTVLAYIAGAVDLAAHYRVVFVAGASEVAVLASALTGAGLGFLVFNRHPARIFMGDTGALAMGGGLGTIAVVLRQEILLLLVGGVFVAEALSVILQVWYFRRTHKRIFKCAPLHHHFEFQEWPESRITRSFWLAGAALWAVAVFGTLGGG
jgi:phospho-N-acetylmuramoyl-pentapeptide-transferase